MASQITYPAHDRRTAVTQRSRIALQSLVLVVEDHDAMRQTLVQLLEMEGIATIAATNGEEALRLIRQHAPKLMLLDMQLPGRLSGLDVLNLVRRSATFAAIRVILHTSEPSAPSLPEAQAADLVVLKPANPDDLLTLIHRLF